jgi:hypothetical protein
MYKGDTHSRHWKATHPPIDALAKNVGGRVFVGNIKGIVGLWIKAGDKVVSLETPSMAWPVEGTIVHGYQETVKVEEGV